MTLAQNYLSFTTILLLTLLGAGSLTQAANIEYVYDDLGRLVEAVDISTTKATYVYDPDGNLVSVTQASASEVTVLNFNPRQGAAGSIVVINGSGFSTTPTLNVVNFNGMSASVTTATSTTLTVVVPTGVTTGLINVTSPTGTATSATNFIIGNFLPVISGFTPTIGGVDAPVTISGSNFDVVAKANRVEFNGMIASVASGTTVSVATRVPPKTGSGPLRVTTPNGSAQSGTDFFVVPAADSSANIATTARINVGDTANTTLAAGKAALYIFNGIAKQLLTIGVSGVTSTSLNVSVLLPDGSTLAGATFGTAGGGLQLPALPRSGVYTVYVKAGVAGSATITIAPPLTGVLTVDSTPSNITISPPGRRALISFLGQAGQAVDLMMTGVTLSASRVSILKPDGNELIAGNVSTAGGMLRPTLPVTGSYSILVDPTGSLGGSITLALVTSPVASLTNNGTDYNMLLATAGQSGEVLFTGTAGQYLNLEVSEVCSLTSPNNKILGASIIVQKPDGSILTTGTFTGPSVGLQQRPPPNLPISYCTGGMLHLNLPVLPLNGSYSVLVQQTSAGSGTLTFALSSPATGAVVVNGVDTSLGVTRAGQGLLLSFTGTAGQYLNLEVSEVCSLTSPNNKILGASIIVQKPDGSILTTGTFTGPSVGLQQRPPPNLPISYCTGGMLHLNLPVLPLNGSYSVLVQQTSAGSGTLTFALSSPATGAVVVNGIDTSLGVTRSGQGLLLSFTGTAGQYLNFVVSEVCSPTMVNKILQATIIVQKPDGSTLTTGTFDYGFKPQTQNTPFSCNGPLQLNLPVLPLSGTYSVLVQQTTAGSGTLTFTLKTI